MIMIVIYQGGKFQRGLLVGSLPWNLGLILKNLLEAHQTLTRNECHILVISACMDHSDRGLDQGSYVGMWGLIAHEAVLNCEKVILLANANKTNVKAINGYVPPRGAPFDSGSHTS